MTCPSRLLVCVVTLIALCAGDVRAVQRGELREWVRTNRRDVNRVLRHFMPPTGIKEIVELTQWTVEGTIVGADAALYEGDRWEFVYTDFIIDVTRVFRSPASTRSTLGTPMPSPVVPTVAATGATPAPLSVRLRALHHGRVQVEGGSITDHSDFPALRVGQHVIASAHFYADLAEWVPVGVFEVREGRVVALERRPYMLDYDSVDAFAAAMANPPPTVLPAK
jgi:hypothetical protein